MPARLRIAGPADALLVAAQGRAAFLEAFASAYSQDEAAAYLRATYGPGLQDGEVADPAVDLLLAEDALGVVGHLKLGPCTLPVEAAADAREVKRFYLLARAHGTGLASALLEEAKALARRRGAAALCLSCWTGNARALAFYQRAGFTVVGSNRFAMGDRIDDDHVLQLRL